MTAPSTSLGETPPASGNSPASVGEEWRRFAAFAARPALPLGGAGEPGAARAVGRMLALDLAVMAVLIGGLSVAMALGFELPPNVNNTLKPDILTVLLIVLAAPLAEELLFRSWLSGRPAIIAVVVVVAAGFGLGPWLGSMAGGAPIAALGGPALTLIIAPLSAYFLLRRPVPEFFRRRFAVFFWASTLAFALVHLANYTEGTLAILLPLVLPQFALGAMLGYLRVHYGLATAIALHAAHNGILFGFAVLGGLGGLGSEG